MRAGFAIVLISLIVCLLAPAHAEPLLFKPRIAIIIDDLGNRLNDGRRVIKLPGNVTVGIMPHTPYAQQLAQFATQHKKEILLHLPMEPLDYGNIKHTGLNTKMTEQELLTSLNDSINSVENIRGISNHMGSRFTQNETTLRWLMKGIQAYGGLYFVDSRTISSSRALKVAKEFGLDHATRDVFLDHDKDPQMMEKQWRYFLRYAKREGSAVMIAHPYPESIQFLYMHLSQLSSEELELVSVSDLIRWRYNRSKLAWHTKSLSH